MQHYSLQVFGPCWWIRHGHEETVGQYGEHYEIAKQCGKIDKENCTAVIQRKTTDHFTLLFTFTNFLVLNSEDNFFKSLSISE